MVLGGLKIKALSLVVAWFASFGWSTSVDTERFLGQASPIKVSQKKVSPSVAALRDSTLLSGPNESLQLELNTVSTQEPLVSPTNTIPVRTLTSVRPQNAKVLAFQPQRSPEKDLLKYQPRPKVKVARQGLSRKWTLPAESEMKKGWRDEVAHQRASASLPLANKGFKEENIRNVRKVPTSTGAPIFVSSVSEDGDRPRGQGSKDRRGKRRKGSVSDGRGDRIHEKGSRTAWTGDADQGVGETQEKIVIAGDFSMAQGLAFNLEEYEVEVTQELNGAYRALAKVNIEEGNFTLEVEDLEGHIIATVFNRYTNQLVGRGELALEGLTPSESGDIKGLSLELSPYGDGIEAAFLSSDTYKSHQILSSELKVQLNPFDKILKIEDKKRIYDGDFAYGSSVLLRALEKNSWASLRRAYAGVRETVMTYSDKYLRMLFEEIMPEDAYESFSEYALVKGRVVQEGKPVSGARVEVEGEYLRPTYFQSFIPDNSLIETSSNGEFVLFLPESGAKYIRMVHDNLEYPAQWISVEPGHVSEVVLDVSFNKPLISRVYDGLADTLLSGQAKYLGVQDAMRFSEGRLDLLTTNSPAFFEVDIDAGVEYPVTRFMFHSKNRFVEWPLLKATQLEELTGQPTDKACPVIVFVNQGEFDISIQTLLPQDNQYDVAYFDKQGQKVEVMGQDVRGFVVQGLDEGEVHLQVVPRSGSRVFNSHFVREKGICQGLRI